MNCEIIPDSTRQWKKHLHSKCSASCRTSHFTKLDARLCFFLQVLVDLQNQDFTSNLHIPDKYEQNELYVYEI